MVKNEYINTYLKAYNRNVARYGYFVAKEKINCVTVQVFISFLRYFLLIFVFFYTLL